MTAHKVLAILFQLISALGVQSARADYGSPVYYTREDTTRCQDQTRNGILGGVAGAAVGAAGGAAIHSPDRGLGAAIGAGVMGIAGGLLGLGLSCEEETRYVRHVDSSLSDYSRPYWEPIERENYRIVLLERGKDLQGNSCSFYQVEFFGPDRRPHAIRETACWIGGAWRHFRYVEGVRPIIQYRSYWNRQPDIRVAWGMQMRPGPYGGGYRSRVDVVGPPPYGGPVYGPPPGPMPGPHGSMYVREVQLDYRQNARGPGRPAFQ